MSRTAQILLALLVLSLFINYIDRGILSIAAPTIERELGLSNDQLGKLLSAFFWSYALLQMFGIAGWFTDRFPVTLVLAVGFFIWSASTALTGIMPTFEGLFLARLLLGAGESVAYPCYSKILAKFYPEDQRGLANGLLDASTKLGPSLASLIGILILSFGWRHLFVALGVGGLLWLIPWMMLRPRDSFTYTDEEKASAPTLMTILSRRSAWGSFLGHFCANYYWFFLLTWLPSYLKKERAFSDTNMAIMSATAYAIIAATTIVTGYIADRWIRNGMTVTRSRKTMTVTGLTLSTVILPMAIVEDSLWAMILLGIACMGFGIFASSHWAITQTLAGPHAAGRWTSLQNGFANIAGIAAPWFTGYVVDQTGRFYVAFLATAAIALFGAFSYGIIIKRVEKVV